MISNSGRSLGNCAYLDNASEQDLEHYGVLGMKWGKRKDPQRAYEKAYKKLDKLDKKALRRDRKVDKRQDKALKKQLKADSAWFFKKHRARSAAKATRKVTKEYRKQQRRQVKALRWHQAMEREFRNVKLNKLDKNYVDLGKKYSDMTVDRIMSNNVSLNALQQTEQYYLGRGR